MSMSVTFGIRIRANLAILSFGLLCVACTSADFQLGEFPGASYSAPNFGDADPVRIKGRDPNTYQVHGVDVSKFNEEIDWVAVNRGGVKFAFIKATEGKDDFDRNLRRNWAGAVAAKIPRSAYHFYYFCATPESQAENYMRRVPKVLKSLPPVLDVEWNPESPTCVVRPPKEEVVDQITRYLKLIEQYYRQKPIIYTTVDFHRDNLANSELSSYQFWLRSVTAQPRFKYDMRPWVFWQYTGTGLAPGFRGPVDLNVFNGTEAQWQRWVAVNTR